MAAVGTHIPHMTQTLKLSIAEGKQNAARLDLNNARGVLHEIQSTLVSWSIILDAQLKCSVLENAVKGICGCSVAETNLNE